MSEQLLIMKFGGSALATPARMRRAARRIAGTKTAGFDVVAVVSAVGRTTDRTMTWIDGLGQHPADACRETDRALAAGEDHAGALLAVALGRNGIAASSLRGGEAGIEGAGSFGAGRVTRVDPDPLRHYLATGRVPVVSGFQAKTGDGETVTLGRGASDLTAVLLAVALEAVACHLVTDVAAVCDRDPHRWAQAGSFGALSHGALERIAREGAREGRAVIDPRAAALARRHRIPLRIYHHRAHLSAPGGTRIGLAAAGSVA